MSEDPLEDVEEWTRDAASSLHRLSVDTWQEERSSFSTAAFPERAMLPDPRNQLWLTQCRWHDCNAVLNSVETLTRHVALHCRDDVSTRVRSDTPPSAKMRCLTIGCISLFSYAYGAIPCAIAGSRLYRLLPGISPRTPPCLSLAYTKVLYLSPLFCALVEN